MPLLPYPSCTAASRESFNSIVWQLVSPHESPWKSWRLLELGNEDGATSRGPDYECGDLTSTTEMGRPLNPQNLVDLVEKLAAAAGVPRITFHDLRHTSATAALEGGVAMKVVTERIGYSNVGFTMQTYAHVRSDADHQAAQQAADFLLGRHRRGDQRRPADRSAVTTPQRSL